MTTITATTTSGAGIRLVGLRKSYDDGRSFAVDGVSLEVPPGELVVLLGASGCGKTTTLKMINRLIEPDAGTITIAGENVRDSDPVLLRRKIGYVFQGIGLLPHLSVAENVETVPRLLKWSRRRMRHRVDELLDLVHLPPEAYRDRLPAELSGGEKQRVGFARALAAEPKVMLMDEPFGALDPITRDALQREFRQLQRDLRLTAVLVTHDMTEALLLADTIAVMDAGRIVQAGPPAELLSRPATAFVDRLLATPKRQADEVERLLEQAAVLQQSSGAAASGVRSIAPPNEVAGRTE